jgi:K+-sensing histidine kinase KdpD
LICEAVRNPRILNISFELRRLLAVGFVLLVFAAVETWLHEPIKHMFEFAGMSDSWQFPTSVFAALAFSVACHRGTHVADHVFNRSYYHEAERLEELGAAAKDTASIESIDAMLTNGPSETLRLASAAVFRDVGGVFRRVSASTGWNDEYGRELPLDDLAKGHAVRLPLKSPSAGETNAVISAPALAVPVVILGKLYAVALYGPHETGDDIDPLEKEILEKFARQVAVGYETARLTSLEKELEALHQRDAKPAASS